MSKTIIKIKIKAGKVSIVHQSHITGSGVHKDKRTKRNHTRSQQRQTWRKERLNG
jgi:hypothetical protein